MCAATGFENETHTHAVVTDSLIGTSENSGLEQLCGGVLGRSRQTSEMLLGEVSELLVVNSSGTGNDKSVGGVVGVDVRLQIAASEVLDVLVRAEDGASQPGAHEGGAVELVEDDLLVLLVHLLALTENDVSLAGDGTLVQQRILKDVSQNLHSLWHVILENFGVIDCLLSGSIGIQVSTHVLNFHFKLLLSSILGAFESHVLQKMSGSIVLVGLVSASGIDPNTNSGSLTVRSLKGHTHILNL